MSADTPNEKILEPVAVEPTGPGEAAVPAESPAGGSSANPWTFVPSLYFMQGLPYVLATDLSVAMYKKMGIPNDQIGLWTSLIGVPWILKMLWGPLVERNGTRRNWIIATQVLLVAALAIAAMTMPLAGFFATSIAVFFVVAFLSATHDIAADGFYLLALQERQQAFFVGIRSAAFRLATIFGSGILVMIAGNFEKNGMPIPRTWMYAIGVGVIAYGVLLVYNLWALPKPPADVKEKSPNPLELIVRFGQVVLMVLAALLIGRWVVMLLGAIQAAGGWKVFTPIDNLTPLFLPTVAGQGAGVDPFPFLTANLVLPLAIQIIGSLALVGIAAASTYQLFKSIGMGPAARTYFAQPGILAILSFILFYRFGESMIGKMSKPFLLDPIEKGGLGVSTQQVGFITGTVGVVALTAGGLLGGLAIARYGMKKSLWPMVLSLNIPNLFYVWAAFAKPGLSAVTALIAVDQFGYGFGFSAYMVYLMFVSQSTRNMQTSHYAISTGLMALGATMAGASSGYVQTWFAGGKDNPNPQAYAWFFVTVCICTIPGMLTLFFIPLKGRDIRKAVEID